MPKLEHTLWDPTTYKAVAKTAAVIGAALFVAIVIGSAIVFVQGAGEISSATSNVTTRIELHLRGDGDRQALVERLRAIVPETDIDISEGEADGVRLSVENLAGKGDEIREAVSHTGWSVEGMHLDTRSPFIQKILDDPRSLLPQLLIGQILAMLLVGTIAVRVSKHTTLPRVTSAVRTGIYLVGGSAIALAGGAVVVFVQGALGYPVMEQIWFTEVAEKTRASDNLFLLAAIVFLVPLAEELLFRGYVFASLTNKVHPAYGYLVSAGTFSVAHLNPSATAVYFVYGLVLAWTYHRTGRLLVPVATHAIINATAVYTTFAT